MAAGFCELSSDSREPEDLRVPRARELALWLRENVFVYATLVECRRQGSSETVVFDVEVEVPQVRTHPIQRIERIAAQFFPSDTSHPEVIALRDDFPRVPHVNLRVRELPRSLCLYNESWRNIKHRWTPARFVARIREWLALTAKGELHQPDQPLEPLFLATRHRIVLPEEILAPEDESSLKQLYVRVLGDEESGFFLMADPKRPEDSKKNLLIAATVHRSPPVEHGIIYRSHSNLHELVELTAPFGLNLLAELREALGRWRDAVSSGEQPTSFLDCFSVVLILLFPKTRAPASHPEATEIHTFFTGDNVKTLGVQLGLWEERDGHLAPLLGTPDRSRVKNVPIDRLNPCFDFTRSRAARLSGFASSADRPRIVAVGVGALGSQVFMNLARSGFGTWTLVDRDRLLPHNLARHALDRVYVGYEKPLTLSYVANSLLNQEGFSTPIIADILSPGDKKDALSKALNEAEIILDMSADVTVARHVALDVDSVARRASLFLNPTGEDLVLLAEDSSRAVQLDSLEMQYYRAIATDPRLKDHFRTPSSPLRYGQSCRDATSTISQDSVGLHAAIGGRAVRTLTAETPARIWVWRSDALGNVRRVDCRPSTTLSAETNGWTVRTDSALLEKLARLRRSKLPNETGGVLLGSFDLDRDVLYLADTIPSPPDSEEWPTVYIRGCKGLRKQTAAYAKATDGLLDYAGEWHSHPGSSTSPSSDDHKVFLWLADVMKQDGLPSVMLIVGQNEARCFAGQLSAPALFPVPQAT